MAAKRAFDLLISVTALAVLSPVLVLLAALVACTMGLPVLFRQDRAGHRGAAFEIYKFRTMRSGEGSDSERLTRVGRFLRAFSLDEIPELFNVIKGEMSLVGPRPLHTSYVERYSAEQARRLEAVPGMTGLAQVNGRNALGWNERFVLDVEYVDTMSLALDLRILVSTVGVVLRRTGVSNSASTTMYEFTGGSETASASGEGKAS